TDWAGKVLGENDIRIEPVAGDASFRRYFRIHRPEAQSIVLMDAPPEQEDSRPFIDIAKRLRAAGLNAPQIHHFDLEQGFGLLEDLGDTLYRAVIEESSVDAHFPQLFDVLARMAGDVSAANLPEYDAGLLQQELDLFPDWFLGRHRRRPFSQAERASWDDVCRVLVENARAQPQVFVHRDFHSCNLMYREGEPPGIIDFQDAVRGPLSYDFISLVWDRYIHWPRDRIEQWMMDLHERLAPDIAIDAWVRHCDLMGLQRNLKVVGIFARLRYRDHKHGYLEMIPMFYRYLLDVLPRYPEFAAFQALLEDESCAP
ncbi:MAG: phosphotransferase, partial [Xanthomonadales bacterium]|nr:phosphotransferase [Xanthomonadales bacterium]